MDAFRPEVVIVEEVRRHLGTDAAHVYGAIVGAIQEECEVRVVPYQGIPVGTIKKQATGKGSANKEAMVAAAKARWPEFDGDDNEADARWILVTAAEQ
jgi:Holliday junction resolvasome RuvABC endonuclease subunit